MAATAGLVGALLMNICTNYEAIVNGTGPDGEFTTTEQGLGWTGQISEVIQCTGMFWDSLENSTPTKRIFLEFRKRDFLQIFVDNCQFLSNFNTKPFPRRQPYTYAAGCCNGDRILSEVRTEALTSLFQRDTYSISSFTGQIQKDYISPFTRQVKKNLFSCCL
jgi:hypothetical protein